MAGGKSIEAEDDQVMAQILKRLLGRWGHTSQGGSIDLARAQNLTSGRGWGKRKGGGETKESPACKGGAF